MTSGRGMGRPPGGEAFTVDFRAGGTQQGPYLDGYDDAGKREQGMRGLLEALGEEPRRNPARRKG